TSLPRACAETICGCLVLQDVVAYTYCTRSRTGKRDGDGGLISYATVLRPRTKMCANHDVGDRVFDREGEVGDRSSAVVVLTPDMTTEEWEVEDGETVADRNPEYGDEPVVIVGFEDDLDEWWTGWRDVPDGELFEEMKERGHKFYAFPESRLEPVDESPIEKILMALDDAGYDDYYVEDDSVVVEKFGEYRIHDDGTVEGEGSLRQQIEKVVDDVDL
ncbi:MAG: hypothetical protein SV760_05700, partial [Halobacteria archaeon]|nr:hypothetical protein [Halobacteria archaeon]